MFIRLVGWLIEHRLYIDAWHETSSLRLYYITWLHHYLNLIIGIVYFSHGMVLYYFNICAQNMCVRKQHFLTLNKAWKVSYMNYLNHIKQLVLIVWTLKLSFQFVVKNKQAQSFIWNKRISFVWEKQELIL